MSAEVITFTEEEREFSKLIAGKVKLISIFLASASLSRGQAADMADSVEMDLTGNTEIKIVIADKGDAGTALLQAELSGVPKQPEHKNHSGLLIKAEFEARYRVDENTLDIETRHRALRALIAHSALGHLWPYWREFVQQSSVRMGFNPVLVPLMVAQPATMKKIENIQGPTPSGGLEPKQKRPTEKKKQKM